jgi:hypothetical protein
MNRVGPRGLIIVLLVGLLFSACGGGSQKTSNSTSSSPPTLASPSPLPLTEFEQRLQFVRNGQYTYIYVFSRKDGKPLDSDDSKFLKTNAPQVVDWVDGGGLKKIIAGTNFNLEEGNLAALRKRYNVEDYSGK